MSSSLESRGISTRTPFLVTRLQPAFGAEITGVDLRQTLTPELRDAIYVALLRYKVIFFHDQDITREQHVALGRAFGELEVDGLKPNAEYPEIMVLKVDASSKHVVTDIWHTDNAWIAVPPFATVTRACVLPSVGGDTVFANAVAAYDGLDEETKARIESLQAAQSVYHLNKSKSIDPLVLNNLGDAASPVTYPVVRIHPDTGERILYVNERYTDYIVGLNRSESDKLLRHLNDQFKRPECQLRFKWRVHSIAMWDNRSTQHYGVRDYNEPRHLERITILGGPAPAGPCEARQPHPLPTHW